MARLTDLVLAGLEDALALERELGVFRVELDRRLLKPVVAPHAGREAQPRPRGYVFLHDGPFEGEAKILVDKMLGALKHAGAVVTDGALPAAETYICLGPKARRRWLPLPEGRQVVETIDPVDVVRYGLDSPLAKPKKVLLWRAVKKVDDSYGEI